ncbi:MAG: metallophosphoesterase [Planctomycetota bacterium]
MLSPPFVPHALDNAILLAVDVALLLALARRPGPRALAGALLGAALATAGAAAGIAGVVPPDPQAGSIFLLFGLLAWGIFLHGPFLALAAAAILRRRRPHWAAASAGLGALLLLLALWSIWIEPRWVEVSHHTIASPKLTSAVRVVVLADLQCARVGDYERSVLRRAAAEKPDLVLLPGDYLHTFTAERYREEVPALHDAFAALPWNPVLGIFAVEGNVDRPGWPAIFAGLGVETMEKTRTVRRGEIALTGLSFADAADPHFELPAAGGFHIVLGHHPDFALGTVPADLLVAGHTHGGQVRLPFWGPLLTLSRVPRTWAAGRTELGGGRTLVVSRGIGMERGHAPRVRFLCRPEIVVLDLVPAAP